MRGMASNATVVVPVKGSASAKSRFGGTPAWRAALAEAIALDSVEAALGGADRVLVVTNAPFAGEFERLGAHVIPDPGEGLTGAVARGIEVAGTGPVAILLGDVPGLRSAELASALEAAASHPLSFVADADREGTVLLVATTAPHRPAFGGQSRAAHLAAGYVELEGDWPGLRRDLDVAEHLAQLQNLGPRTALLVSGLEGGARER